MQLQNCIKFQHEHATVVRFDLLDWKGRVFAGAPDVPLVARSLGPKSAHPRPKNVADKQAYLSLQNSRHTRAAPLLPFFTAASANRNYPSQLAQTPSHVQLIWPRPSVLALS